MNQQFNCITDKPIDGDKLKSFENSNCEKQYLRTKRKIKCRLCNGQEHRIDTYKQCNNSTKCPNRQNGNACFRISTCLIKYLTYLYCAIDHVYQTVDLERDSGIDTDESSNDLVVEATSRVFEIRQESLPNIVACSLTSNQFARFSNDDVEPKGIIQQSNDLLMNSCIDVNESINFGASSSTNAFAQSSSPQMEVNGIDDAPLETLDDPIWRELLNSASFLDEISAIEKDFRNMEPQVIQNNVNTIKPFIDGNRVINYDVSLTTHSFAQSPVQSYKYHEENNQTDNRIGFSDSPTSTNLYYASSHVYQTADTGVSYVSSVPPKQVNGNNDIWTSNQSELFSFEDPKESIQQSTKLANTITGQFIDYVLSDPNINVQDAINSYVSNSISSFTQSPLPLSTSSVQRYKYNEENNQTGKCDPISYDASTTANFNYASNHVCQTIDSGVSYSTFPFEQLSLPKIQVDGYTIFT